MKRDYPPVGSCAIDCAHEIASTRLPPALRWLPRRNQLRDYLQRGNRSSFVKVHYCARELVSARVPPALRGPQRNQLRDYPHKRIPSFIL
jgi:hypothetical protein